eukprot:10823066-Prorocentrum_lima.AAC.1
MKTRDEQHASHLKEKDASVNYELNVLASNQRKNEECLMNMYKEKLLDLQQTHGTKESEAVVQLEKT